MSKHTASLGSPPHTDLPWPAQFFEMDLDTKQLTRQSLSPYILLGSSRTGILSRTQLYPPAHDGHHNSLLNEQRAPTTCCQIITPYNCGITCCKLLELGMHFNENVTIKQDLGEKVTNPPIIWILPLFIFTLQWTRSQQGTSFYNILFAFIQT